MNWMHEGGSQWKQGWSGQTLASISTPSIHLLIIFAIVIFLLSSSNPMDNKIETRTSTGLFSMLLLIAGVCGGAYYMLHGGLNLNFQNLRHGTHREPHRFTHQGHQAHGVHPSSFPG